jgi:hypothetical protein
MLTQNSPAVFQPAKAEAVQPQVAAARSLAQVFGLEIRAAILTVIVDLLVFAGDTFSLEALLPLGVAVAAALGFIVYKIQKKWYGDDHESALIKAMIIAIMTAIPVPITPLFAVPGGLIAIAGRWRRRKTATQPR